MTKPSGRTSKVRLAKERTLSDVRAGVRRRRVVEQGPGTLEHTDIHIYTHLHTSTHAHDAYHADPDGVSTAL